MSDSLQPHGLQHTRLPCSSLFPRICSNSCPLSWSSSVALFSCPWSCPESGSLLMSQLFASGRQIIGSSASTLVLQINSQIWFPLWLTGFIFLMSKGLTGEFSRNRVQKHQLFGIQPFYGPTHTSVHGYWKKQSFDYMDFVSKVMSVLFNMLSRFVTAFLPRSKHLLISWLQSWSTVFLEPKKIKSVTVSMFPLLFTMKWWDQMPWS